MIRAELDVGLLSNVRMGAEIAAGLAFLTGRRLSLPFDQSIPGAPRSSIEEQDLGRPATLLDLFELPVPIVHPDEWPDYASLVIDRVDWGTVGTAVCVCHDDYEADDPQLVDFANGRPNVRPVPRADAPVLVVDGRLLSFYSYFFYARPAERRQLQAVLRGVRPRRAFTELGATIASDVGRFNALHLRRSDLTIGIPAYNDVTPEHVARNLARILPTDELLMVCSEVDGRDPLFDPLRHRFPSIVFANDVILGDHRRAFFSLPRHEDNALGLITQIVAARADQFVGTIGSTFTAMIQRERLLRDPNERFRYTADFTPEGPRFHNGEFLDRHEGSYSWNRIGYSMAPDTLAWFREWPEVA